MSVCTVGGLQTKPALDSQLFKIQWAELLEIGDPYLNVVDRIASSAWTFDAASPATATVTIGASGFDAQTGTTWVILAGGTDGDVVFVNNTVTTTGASVNGQTTPSQVFVRQIRVRVRAC